jgi:hypothetical protein
MKRKLSVFTWIVIVTVTVMIAFSVMAQPQPPNGQPPNGQPPQPPKEAIAACKGKREGNSCQINTPQGTITGVCSLAGNQLACTPEGGPPQGGGN